MLVRHRVEWERLPEVVREAALTCGGDAVARAGTACGEQDAAGCSDRVGSSPCQGPCRCPSRSPSSCVHLLDLGGVLLGDRATPELHCGRELVAARLPLDGEDSKAL